MNPRDVDKHGKKTIIGTLFDLYNAGSNLQCTSNPIAKMFTKGAEYGFDFEKSKHKKVNELIDFIESKLPKTPISKRARAMAGAKKADKQAENSTASSGFSITRKEPEKKVEPQVPAKRTFTEF